MTDTLLVITNLINAFIVPTLATLLALQAILMRRMADRMMMQEGRITILEHVNGLEYADGKVLRKFSE